MKLQGTFELDNGVTIIDPILELMEIKPSAQVGISFVNIELSVSNATAKLSFIYHYSTPEPDEVLVNSWILSQLYTYKIS